MKARVKETGEIVDVYKNIELDAYLWINSETEEGYYKEEIEILE